MSVEGIKTSKFRPLELNERNVKAIFKRCLANEDNTKEGVYYSQVLSLEKCGKESEIIRFSKEMVDAYTSSIQYLLGQVKAFQDYRETFALQEGFLRYDDTFWTKDYDVLFKLYALALSSASITNFFSHGELKLLQNRHYVLQHFRQETLTFLNGMRNIKIRIQNLNKTASCRTVKAHFYT